MENKKYQLPREFATKWIEALRSGEYGQTVRELTNGNDDYCCLGVACKIAGYSDMEMFTYNNVVFQDTPFNKLPFSLHENEELTDILVRMNDLENKSFIEISQWITENVEFI